MFQIEHLIYEPKSKADKITWLDLVRNKNNFAVVISEINFLQAKILMELKNQQNALVKYNIILVWGLNEIISLQFVLF